MMDSSPAGSGNGRRCNNEDEPISVDRNGGPRRTPQQRQVRQSEGAEGSLDIRQVRKRIINDSDNESEGAEGSLVGDRQSRKHSLLKPNYNKNVNNRRSRRDSSERNRSRDRPYNRRRRVRYRDDFVNKGRDKTRLRDESSDYYRSRKRFRDSSSDDEIRATRVGRRRHRSSSSDSYDTPTRRLLKRGRTRSPSRRTKRELTEVEMPDATHSILNKFLNVLNNVKEQSTSKLSLTNVIPEFDPLSTEQTIVTWLTKVEEAAEIYNWDERETIHFALPKLVGLAQTWYKGLSTMLYSWTEWKRKLIESFPCRYDYAELLTQMLAKRVRYGESLEQYYYAKINLLNRCGIVGRKAVDCLLHGVDDRAVRIGAQAARFRGTEDVLKYFKTIKPGTSRETADRSGQDKRNSLPNNNRNKSDANKRSTFVIKCHNCNEEGHKSFKCNKPLMKCTLCNREGHLDLYCRSKRPAIQNTERPSSEVKDEKQVALVNYSDDTNQKYVLEILVNGQPINCQVDLGSQCTLVRESEAKRLKLNTSLDRLPVLRGLGGFHIKPLGKCNADVTVQGIKENIEILIVEDAALKHPALLGHTFTEKPGITIIKTPNEVVFEQDSHQKIFLVAQGYVVIAQKQLSVIPVTSRNSLTGFVYVNGSVRGTTGKEYYLLPGEYKLHGGFGNLLLQNLSDSSVCLKHGSLLTRAIPIMNEQNVYSVTFDDKSLDESVQCGDTITSGQKLEIQRLLSKFKDCFSSGLKDLGFTNATEMVIELNDVEPVVYRPYRMSYGERALVRDMVQEMMHAGIVTESTSSYASPIVLVKKKTGEKRLCVDYRALNKRTKKDHYPLPLIDDQLDRLAGNKLFTSLDLASGYYQIPIEKSSQDKTAFVTPDGQFQYTRMPFGLVNAPSVFQRTINKILSEAKIKYALVYMDDILIPARSFDEGLCRLEEVLFLLKRGGLTLKLSKCNFFMDSIEFLGFQINADGIKPGERKTEAVSKFRTPNSQRELQQFIGLASFFRRFVKGFATIAKPLTDLLRKNITWKWGSEQVNAFETIKSTLVQRPLLALYDPTRETEVHTDASKYGIGGILLQKDDAGHLRPVSYFSRKTTPDEQKLHSFELETLAVVSSLNRFRVYLIGVPFKILTDCNALRTTLSKRDLIPRIARWWVQFQEFNCEIEYRPGCRMSHADALSRNPVGEAKDDSHVLDVLTVGTDDWIATVQSNDDEIARIREILNDPKSNQVLDVIKNYKLKNGKVYRIVGKEENDLRWVVPKGVRWQIAKINHDDLGHFGFDKTFARIQQIYWFPKMRRFIKKYTKSCLECARSKDHTGKVQGGLHPIPKVETPFHTIHADHLGPFVRSKKGNCYLLVIVDGFTKFINIKPVRNTKSSTSIKALKEHISYFGAPSRLITDRGTSFTSNSFRAFIQSMGIKHILNAVATPRANGQCERYNRTILSALTAKTDNKDDRNWDDYILDIQIGLNTTVHKTTGKSPSELLLGFNIRSSSENALSDIIDDVREFSTDDLGQVRSKAGTRIAQQQVKDKIRYDTRHKRPYKYNSGDLVSIKREVPSDGKSKKLAAKFQGPYRILKVLPNDRFLIEDTPLTRNHGQRRYENVIAIDRIKPWLAFDRNYDSTESESEDNVNQDSTN